jgi:hypothetical protein
VTKKVKLYWLSVLQVLYYEDNKAYMTNFFVKNLLFYDDYYEFILHHYSDAKIYPHNTSGLNHPDFYKEHHFHAYLISNEIIYKEPELNDFSTQMWSLELYFGWVENN